MIEANKKRETLLDKLLEGKDGEFRSKVLNIVVESGLTPDDPVFLLLVAVGSLQVLLEDAPLSFETILKNQIQEIERVQHLVETTTIERQKVAIANASSELIKKAEKQEATRFFSAILPAGAVLLGAIGVGVLLGVSLPRLLTKPLDPTGPVQLTLDEAQALQWAMSEEGKLARNLMKWNQGWLEQGKCEQLSSDLGIKLTLNGKLAKNGFCVLWVKPPQSIQFQEETMKKER